MQVTVFAVGPAQIALIRLGLAAKALTAGSLDVSCSTGRCETGSVGFEGVNQIHDSEMGRTDWEPVVAPALAAIRAIWWYQPWCFVLKVLKDRLNHLGVFMLAMTFTCPQQCSQTAIAMFKTRLSRCIPAMAVWRCAGLLSPQPVSGTLALSGLLPRVVGVTCARCWLLGAKTRGSG